MYDLELVLTILSQINETLDKIKYRSENIDDASCFTDSPAGMEKLDSICMLLLAIGESIKNIDKITSGKLLPHYPEIDWKGIKKLRDIIAHHYFDVDADEIFWILKNEIDQLMQIIRKMIKDLKDENYSGRQLN